MDGVLGQVLHGDAGSGLLLEHQLRARGVRCEEIANVLVVDLEVADQRQVADAGGDGDRFEDVIEGAWDDAALFAMVGGGGGGIRGRIVGTLHGVGFAAAGLTVGEDRGVVAFENVLKGGGSEVGENVQEFDFVRTSTKA